jgi:hypothetical protein
MIALLLFMLGATETKSGPVVAPVGIVITIPVSVHELTVIKDPLSVTRLPPCRTPKAEPVIRTSFPTEVVVAERLVMAGPGDAAELIETLSNVPVARELVFRLLTYSPT